MLKQELDEKVIFSVAVNISDQDALQHYLAQACGDNDALKHRVKVLLRMHDEESSFLEIPDRETTRMAREPDLSPLHPSESQFGPYKLREKLAVGGMGAVFVAEQSEPVRRKVALKVIRTELASPNAIARFEAERQALAMMDHPNIARVFDGGQTSDGQPYFVMELVQGVPITEFCDDRKLTTRERLELVRDVCRAVQHAHLKGIIHRDLKPSNILVAEIDGKAVPKVIDFGVAKATMQPLTDQTVYTQHNQMIGTPLYMSPEQASMGVIDVDTRSDVYSLGVLLYELLTGSPPFDREAFRQATFDEIRRVVREDMPRRPSHMVSTLQAEALSTRADRRRVDERRLRRELHGELDWITLKALEKDRGRRYQSAGEFADDLQHYLDGQAVEACPPSWSYHIQTWTRRNRGLLAATSVALTLLVGGIATTSWQLMRALDAETEANANAELAKDKAKRAEQEAQISAAVIEFLDQDLLANSDPRRSGGEPVTIRQVLDQAAVALESRLDKTPLVRATLHQTIARSYVSLSELDRASHHFTSAHNLFVEELGAKDPKALNCLLGLAGVRIQESKLTEARSLTDQILAALNSGDSTSLEVERRTEGFVEVIQCDSGNYQQAAERLAELFEKNRRDFGSDHSITIQSLSQLAAAELKLSHFGVAQQHYQELVRINTEQLGSNHPDTLSHREQLGVVQIKQGRYSEAEELFRSLAVALEQIYGADHPSVIQSFHHVAVALQSQGKFDEALEIYEKVIAARDATIGPDHPKTFSSQANQASVLQSLGRAEEAANVLRELISRQSAVQGDAHPQVTFNQTLLADLLAEMGKLEEAETLSKRVVAKQEQSLGPDHFLTMSSLNTLATILMRAEQFEDAEPILRRLLKAASSKLGENHPNVLATKANLAVTLGELKQLEIAETMLREVLSQREKTVAPEDRRRLPTMSSLASVLNEQKKFDEAESLSRRLVEVASVALGVSHQITVDGRYARAVALRGLQQDDSAAEVFFKAGQGFVELGDWEKALESLRAATELQPKNEMYSEALSKAEAESTAKPAESEQQTAVSNK